MLVAIASWETPWSEIQYAFTISGNPVDSVQFYTAISTGKFRRRVSSNQKGRVTMYYTPDNRQEKGI